MQNNNHILVVDDSSSLLSMVKEYLRMFGYKTAIAKNGKEALKKIKANSFDLILLDVNLPDISGYEVCRQLKSNDLSKEIPVIFITVRSDPESMKRGFEAGGVDYLTKPFHREELLLRVKTHIDLKRSRSELLEAKEFAEKSEKLKMAFLSNMSHEIRTPMNAIIGFAELLLDKDISEKERGDFINIVINSSHHLLDIVNNILEISKQEAGELKIIEQEFSLNKFMQDVQKVFTKHNRNIPIEVRLNIPELENDKIIADNMRLQQIFDNLLNNAAKFTHEGHIEIGYQLKPGNTDKLEFFVKDTGIGIPKDKQKIIFERFTQVEDPLTRLYHGTGLGLPIIKGLVLGMGGTISVTSQPGKGSIFNFTLPYNPAGPVLKQEQKNTNKPKGFIEGDWENKTILIADDVDVVLQFFTEALRNTKVHLLYAKNGNEALAAFQKNRSQINLCIFDVQMPLMNGLDLARAIRKEDKNMPMIAQTGLALNVSENDTFEAGFNDCLYKPIKLDVLQKIIDKYL